MTGRELALAAFSLGGKLTEVKEIERQLHEIPAYGALLDSGMLGTSQSEELITQAFGESPIASVCKLLARKRKMYLWSDFVMAFQRLWDQKQGITEVQIKSSQALSPELRKRLIGALEKHLGKTVRLKVEVIPHLLGGISVLAEGRYWDGTLRGQLEHLRNTLQGGKP